MNQILIWEPRWHDRTVLVAEHRLFEHNQIQIQHHEFPEPFYLSRAYALTFPQEYMKTKNGQEIPMRAIPLAELAKEVVM